MGYFETISFFFCFVTPYAAVSSMTSLSEKKGVVRVLKQPQQASNLLTGDHGSRRTCHGGLVVAAASRAKGMLRQLVCDSGNVRSADETRCRAEVDADTVGLYAALTHVASCKEVWHSSVTALDPTSSIITHNHHKHPQAYPLQHDE